MTKSFVIVSMDLVKELNFEEKFRYRTYVNNELFSERTWIWDDRFYLEENLTIEAPAGEYTIDVQVHGAAPEVLKVKNLRITQGPGRLKDNILILD